MKNARVKKLGVMFAGMFLAACSFAGEPYRYSVDAANADAAKTSKHEERTEQNTNAKPQKPEKTPVYHFSGHSEP